MGERTRNYFKFGPLDDILKNSWRKQEEGDDCGDSAVCGPGVRVCRWRCGGPQIVEGGAKQISKK